MAGSFIGQHSQIPRIVFQSTTPNINYHPSSTHLSPPKQVFYPTVQRIINLPPNTQVTGNL
jgi:hypothetical protein